MHEDRAGDAAPARRVEAVLDGDVVVHDDIVGVDALILRHIDRHFEVQDVARIILHDREDAAIGGDGLDSFIDLVRRRRCEHGARHGTIEHAAADVAGVRRLVSAAAAGDESDLAFFFRLAHDDVAFWELSELVRRFLGDAFNHLAFDVFHLVDQFLHTDPPFL